MVPFFFGRPERRLWGVHRPPRGKARRTAALLLYPGVEEYNPLHWAFRKLESALAQGGLDVMRFDWFGTGDSAGEPEERTLDGWADDARAAEGELVDRTGARRVVVVGMRLGAVIAARACARGLRPHHVVMWDPIATGAPYMAELDRLHRARKLHLLHGARPDDGELLGYRISRAHRRELEAIDLAREVPKGLRFDVVTPKVRDGQDRLGVTPEVVVEDDGALTQTTGDSAVLPNRIIAAVAARVLGVA